MSWIAEYDTQGREFPTCVHVTKTIDNVTHGATYVPIEDGKAVRAENVELRKERDFYYNQVIENGERAQRAIDALNAENDKLRGARDTWQENDAKLRELVREMYEFMSIKLSPNETYSFANRMRKLGMEVE